MATMSISNSNGTYNFPSSCIPLYSKDFEYIRLDPQGPSCRRCRIRLNGFFEGDDLNDIMDQYASLRAILEFNDVLFSFNDGTNDIYSSKRMQIASYSEPQDWKQYDGTYEIELYFYESHGDDIPIVVTYGGYTFDPIPTWSRQINQNRSRCGILSPSGESLGSTGVIRVRGKLTASSHSGLVVKINSLEAALDSDGILTYGDLAQSVRILRHEIQEVVPEFLAFYTIEFEYSTSEIIELSASIRHSRLHRNPVIKEKPLCNSRIIKLMNLSGQEVDYAISISAETVATARSLLSAEVAYLVAPGGIEMPGGSEDWNYNTCTVSLNIRKFHTIPILSNIGGGPGVFVNGDFVANPIIGSPFPYTLRGVLIPEEGDEVI